MESLDDNDIFYGRITNLLFIEISKIPSCRSIKVQYDINSDEILRNKHIFLIKHNLSSYFYRRYKYRDINATATDYGVSVTIDCEN